MVYKETLLHSDGDFSMGIERLLFDALLTGRHRYLKRLLKTGFNPNVVDSNKVSLLTHACLLKDADLRFSVVSFLLKKGAQVNVPDQFMMDSLMHATLAGHSNILELLINHSSDDINLKACPSHPEYSYPLLSLAVISRSLKSVDVIRQLHKKSGVHVDDVMNEEGITPYMEAKRRIYTKIADYLLHVGRASPLRVANDGRSIPELTAEFQKKKAEEIDHEKTEWEMINPPRYSVLHPTHTSTKLKNGIERSKSVSFFTTRENTAVDFDTNMDRYSLRQQNRLRLSFGKMEVLRNQSFVHDFQPKLNDAESANDTAKRHGVEPQDYWYLHEVFQRKSDSLGNLKKQCFSTDRVALDEKEQSLVRKAERKLRRQQRAAAVGTGGDWHNSQFHRHAGYELKIPESIGKELAKSKKEKVFVGRRPSETKLKSVNYSLPNL